MPRGQNLVLFALFLLLLTVAVLATVGITQQARRKLELDTAADAAAYSQAVATARTLNSVALLNRAQAATMVAMTGAQSAISFAGTYRAVNSAAMIGYNTQWDKEYCEHSSVSGRSARYCGGVEEPLGAFHHCTRLQPGAKACTSEVCTHPQTCTGVMEIDGPCSNPDHCTAHKVHDVCGAGDDFKKRVDKLREESFRVYAIWTALDQAAGKQVLAIQTEAFAIGGLQRASLGVLARTRFEGVLGPASANFVHQLAAAEVARMIAPGSVPTAVEVAMGSRAHSFITRRADGTRALQAAIDRVLTPAGAAGEVVVQPLLGNGYFATTRNHGTDPTEQAAWGDEHSNVAVDFRGNSSSYGVRGASSVVEFMGWASSTDLQDVRDAHEYCPHVMFGDKPLEPKSPEEHTLLPHQVVPVDTCPGSSCIWPDFTDVNTAVLSNAGDAFGQPKAQVTASLPVDPRHPWNFAFRFAVSGSGTSIDLRQGRGVATLTPLPHMVSTAMAYYHRPGHWKEPPTLFNPFWRATLVRGDIDDPPLNDLAAGAGTQAPWASQAVVKLMAAGYRGIP